MKMKKVNLLYYTINMLNLKNKKIIRKPDPKYNYRRQMNCGGYMSGPKVGATKYLGGFMCGAMRMVFKDIKFKVDDDLLSVFGPKVYTIFLEVFGFESLKIKDIDDAVRKKKMILVVTMFYLALFYNGVNSDLVKSRFQKKKFFQLISNEAISMILKSVKIYEGYTSTFFFLEEYNDLSYAYFILTGVFIGQFDISVYTYEENEIIIPISLTRRDLLVKKFILDS